MLAIGDERYFNMIYISQVYIGQQLKSAVIAAMKDLKSQNKTGNDEDEELVDSSPVTSSPPSHDSSYCPSEEAVKLYEPIMRSVSVVEMEFLKQKLNNIGIYYRKDQCQKQFTKYCLKNDWESTIYQVRYGHFQSTIKMIVVNLDPKVFCHPPISKGNFGQVFLFQIKQKAYALKNIKIYIEKSSVLDKALKQVFLAKIFSALQIGPQFTNIFTYDAVLYKNNFQYAMELCEMNFYNLSFDQADQHSLLASLKIMHSFNICHYDIKLDNIGWSDSLNKFVFLDFGLTEILAQPQGYKTKTKFKGTYGYCSPEMKKLHHTKTSSYIDSYYNDLHCLQVTLNQLAKIKMQTRFFKPQEASTFLAKMPHQQGDLLSVQPQKESDRQVHIKQNEALIRFFYLKLSLFKYDYENVQKLIESQTMLIQTFRKIIYFEKQSSKNDCQLDKVYEKIFLKSQQIRQNLSLMNQLDALLYEYSIRNECKSKLVSSHRKFEQMAESKKIFDSQWENGDEKQTIFNLIDVYHNNDEGLRSKLIEKVYDKISTTQSDKKEDEVSSTLKLRQILLYYFQQFSEKKDTLYLQKIVVYFELMNDEYYSEKIKQHILDTHLQDGKFMMFLVDNFKFFIGSFLTVNRKMPCVSNKFIVNARKLISDKGDLLNQECKAALEFMVSFMRTIKQIQDFYKISETEYLLLKKLVRQFTEKYSHHFPSEMEQLLDTIMEMRHPSSSKYAPSWQSSSFPAHKLFQDIKFENLYLQKCCLKMKILNLYYNQQVHSLTHLLQSQPFLNPFLTYYHHTTLSNSSQSQLTHRQQIARDYLTIRNNSQQQLIIDQDYLIVLDMLHSKAEIEDIVRGHYCGYGLGEIREVETLGNFCISLRTVFSYFFKSYSNFGNYLSPGFVNFLCQVFGPFVQFTQMLLQHLSPTSQPKQNQPHPQTPSSKILQSTKYIKMFINLLQRKTKQSLQILQQIMDSSDSDNQRCSKSVFLSSLYAIEERSGAEDRGRVREVMLRHAEIMEKEMKFKTIPMVPQYLQKILHLLLPESLPKATSFLKSLFKYIHFTKLPIFRYSYVLLVTERFLYEICSVRELGQLIKDEMQGNLREFWGYGKFLFLVGMAGSRVRLEKGLMMRLIRVCYFFMPTLSEGWFRNYKTQFLKNTVYKNLPKSKFTLYQNRRIKYSSMKKLQAYIDKEFGIRRHCQKHLTHIGDVREKIKEKFDRLEEVLE